MVQYVPVIKFYLKFRFVLRWREYKWELDWYKYLYMDSLTKCPRFSVGRSQDNVFVIIRENFQVYDYLERAILDWFRLSSSLIWSLLSKSWIRLVWVSICKRSWMHSWADDCTWPLRLTFSRMVLWVVADICATAAWRNWDAVNSNFLTRSFFSLKALIHLNWSYFLRRLSIL